MVKVGGGKIREVRRTKKESIKTIKTIKQEEEANNTMPEYIYAYDPIVKKRVVHVVVDGWAISMVSGNRFKYRPSRGR